MSNLNTTTETIMEYLRSNDLTRKKIESHASELVGYTVMSGDAKEIPKECKQSPQELQAIYDLSIQYLKTLRKLRRANASTFTDVKNYFTNEKMTIIDARQNIVAGSTQGTAGEVAFLKKLRNKLAEQTNSIKAAVQAHNQTKTAEFKRTTDDLYARHLKDRDEQLKAIGTLPPNFESDYLEKIEKMQAAFWQSNKAFVVDLIDVYSLLYKLDVWINDYDKFRESKINNANEESVGNPDNVIPKFDDVTETVSLEVLMSLIKETQANLQTAIDRLVSASWKVSQKGDPMNFSVNTAKEDIERILLMIQSLGKMKSAVNVFTTFTPIGLENPLTHENMTAVDAVDLKNFTVPVFKKVLNILEKQRYEAKKKADDSEQSARSSMTDAIKNVMTNATNGHTSSVDELKAKYTGLVESMTKKVVESPQLAMWITKFKELIDFAETKIETSLATTNSVTAVPVTWKDTTIPVVKGSWESVKTIDRISEQFVKTNTTAWYDQDELPWVPPSTVSDESSLHPPSYSAGRGGRGGSRGGRGGRSY